MGKKFGQVECANYLKRSHSPEEAFEVLCAYVYAKYAKGSNTAQVVRKMHLLICYMRGVQLHSILTVYQHSFLLTLFHVQKLDGAAIGAFPITTPLGLEAWNTARRIAYKPSGKGGPRITSPGGATLSRSLTGPMQISILDGVDPRHLRGAREQMRATYGVPELVATENVEQVLAQDDPLAAPGYDAPVLPAYDYTPIRRPQPGDPSVSWT